MRNSSLSKGRKSCIHKYLVPYLLGMYIGGRNKVQLCSLGNISNGFFFPFSFFLYSVPAYGRAMAGKQWGLSNWEIHLGIFYLLRHVCSSCITVEVRNPCVAVFKPIFQWRLNGRLCSGPLKWFKTLKHHWGVFKP